MRCGITDHTDGGASIGVLHQRANRSLPGERPDLRRRCVVAREKVDRLQRRRGGAPFALGADRIFVECVESTFMLVNVTAGSLHHVAPQPQPGYARLREERFAAAHKRADIIGKDRTAVVVERRCERRFPRSRMAEKCYRVLVDDNGIGVERQDSALVQQHANCRSQQEQPDITVRSIAVVINCDAGSSTNPEARHVRDRQDHPERRDAEQQRPPLVRNLRHVSQVDRDGILFAMRTRVEFGQWHLRAERQAEKAIFVHAGPRSLEIIPFTPTRRRLHGIYGGAMVA